MIDAPGGRTPHVSRTTGWDLLPARSRETDSCPIAGLVPTLRSQRSDGLGRVVSNESSNEHADTRPDPLHHLDGPSRELPAQRYQRLPTVTCCTGFE